MRWLGGGGAAQKRLIVEQKFQNKKKRKEIKNPPPFFFHSIDSWSAAKNKSEIHKRSTFHRKATLFFFTVWNEFFCLFGGGGDLFGSRGRATTRETTKCSSDGGPTVSRGRERKKEERKKKEKNEQKRKKEKKTEPNSTQKGEE